MLRFRFNRLYSNLEILVKEEQKIDPSWLMGFLQGRGRKKLSGYQMAALVNLLLVHPAPPAVPDAHIPKEEKKVPSFGSSRP